ncbi:MULTISPECIES: peptidase C39 family protein [unclassified Streptomyces]|uniref:peptidase C39 family protein n=1 Tax=unclassified Streptomyces TaxID=2593676 RepID=UPI002ED2866A|nr:peptidase C39 family protein [Streptomyces sp. NBC_00891]WSY04393.1 peptidase C39 family protein [Streptomyces sp. NBC_00890]WSZ06018.1 peptidase C39 family protein [Streptomyces sp. NBC_00869]WSZ26486.1 peptidase C39 family protein [Streptomyces sp. NBC_00870]
MPSPTSRRTVLAAAIAAAAGAGALSSAASASAAPRRDRPAPPSVDNHAWTTYPDWRFGRNEGTRAVAGRRAGLAIAHPLGRTDYTDPHTGTTATWEYATWTSPVHRSSVPATEVIASWNADTPAGTWIQTELSGRYSDGTETPWYVMGRWAAGDGDIRRTSVDDQSDGKSSIWTDTFSVDDAASGLRLLSYRLRLTLYRTPGTRLTPTVWRVGAMASDIPDRFTVPASTPGLVRELAVPRYSQNVHVGQYPEYDNGGEAWCSPTSSQMIIEYWGRRPSAADLAWVEPGIQDPQVCHAARYTYDNQYEGCGNWPFNAAYAATYRDMSSAVTRLGSLKDVETLVRAGIPVITSQSFLKEELTGAGYGTSGHLMTVIGFTADGDVIANDPASPDDDAVRHVYKRHEWETIWLRTKRYDANGNVKSGTGGVCYVYWPAHPSPAQRWALRSLGLV